MFYLPGVYFARIPSTMFKLAACIRDIAIWHMQPTARVNETSLAAVGEHVAQNVWLPHPVGTFRFASRSVGVRGLTWSRVLFSDVEIFSLRGRLVSSVGVYLCRRLQKQKKGKMCSSHRNQH